MKNLKGSILSPIKHENVPKNAKWLSGQGEGTWFSITKEFGLKDFEYRIRRISPQGNLDCDRVFILEDNNSALDLTKEWNITHLSHCAEVRVLQNNSSILLNFEKEFN
jgi:hypothetical protein